jgi:hypothetical protein
MITKPELTVNTTVDCSFFLEVLATTSCGTAKQNNHIRGEQQQKRKDGVEPTNETSRITNTTKTMNNPT